MISTSDVRHAFRHLRQSPGYTSTAVLTFALAIGANSAIFSAVNAVLLRPLPVEAPQNLAVVWQTDEGGKAVVELTHRHLREWTSSSTTFVKAAVMGSHNWSAVIQDRGEPSKIWFNGVSGAFFETLGVKPVLGRGLGPQDDVPNVPLVAVLNHGAWVRRFGADPDIVGKTMTLDGSPTEIVGVMPEGVDFPRGAEFWVPIVPMLGSGTPPNTKTLDAVGVFYVLGRLRPGLDADKARTEIDATEAHLDRINPGRLKWGSRAVSTPFLDHVFGPVRPALRVLVGGRGCAVVDSVRQRVRSDADAGLPPQARAQHQAGIRRQPRSDRPSLDHRDVDRRRRGWCTRPRGGSLDRACDRRTRARRSAAGGGGVDRYAA